MNRYEIDGFFSPCQTNYPYGEGGPLTGPIVSAGYRVSKRQEPDEVFPNGYYLVYRKLDGEFIGRVEKEGAGWKGRYYFFGGGNTYGTFRTRKDACSFILQKNARLEKGWNQ
jgi:hypothetical protein